MELALGMSPVAQVARTTGERSIPVNLAILHNKHRSRLEKFQKERATSD